MGLNTQDEPGTAGRRLKILLVEDHKDSAEVLSLLLTKEGHEVLTAGEIATALDVAKKVFFDVLLSDMGLPDGTGADLMRQLRAKGLTIPGIALSGHGH